MKMNLEILDDEFTVLWQDKTNAPSNVWGIENNQNSGFISSLSGGQMTIRHQGVSYLALIFWGMLVSPLPIGLFWCIHPIAGITAAIAYFYGLLYWVLIREIKYYRLSKNTEYKITNQEVLITSRPYWWKKTFRFPLDEINQIHLVRFNRDGLETGSIYLYADHKTKTVNITQKERTHQIILERVIDYKTVYQILQKVVRQNQKDRKK